MGGCLSGLDGLILSDPRVDDSVSKFIATEAFRSRDEASGSVGSIWGFKIWGCGF